MRYTEREAETQAEGEAGSMHREPDVGLDPGSPGSCPGPKASAKPLRHPGIPKSPSQLPCPRVCSGPPGTVAQATYKAPSRGAESWAPL